MLDYKKYISGKDDWIDMTKLFADPVIFNSLIDDMCKPFLDKNIDKVAAIDAMGFIFGARIAEKLDVGLVLIRKEDKLQVPRKSISFTDYSDTEKALEIADGSLISKEKVLLVDDITETGAQLVNAIELITLSGGKVVGVSCVSISDRVRSDSAFSKYILHAVVRF